MPQKMTMSAAFAAILAASMPMAFAAEPMPAPTTPSHSAATNPSSPADHTASGAQPMPQNATAPRTAANQVPSSVQPGQFRFSEMNGATVYGSKNDSIGDIDDVVLGQNGKVDAVVIKHGGFLGIGGKDVAVSMKDLQVSTDKNGKPRFALNMTKDQLKSAQEFNLNPPKNAASGGSTPPATATGSSTAPAAPHPAVNK